MVEKKKKDIKNIKDLVNQKHIIFYDKTLEILNFILDEYSKELTRADIEFLEMPKNSIATLDFLISSIVKVQKGHRLALGLDENELLDTSPQINIIEGLVEDKI
jgi:archaellum component FlaC